MRRDLHLRVLRDRRPRRVPRRDVVRLPTPTGATVMNIDELIRMSLLEAERDAALAELRRVRPVVDAAKAWRNTEQPDWYIADADELALIAAVDALEAAETAERQVPDA